MKIATCSDLHQEFTRDRDSQHDPHTRFDLASLPDADVTVIAGDLDVHLCNSLRRIADELPGQRVVYVAGNHDFWNIEGRVPQTIEEMIADARVLAGELGIDFLSDDTVEIEGVRFVGATLWTDMESVGRGHKASKMSEAGGKFGMNDYRRMRRWSTKHPGKRSDANPAQTVAAHHASRQFIEDTVAQPFAGPTVVVTHHAPHPNSLDPRHGNLTWCYASNLELLIQEAQPDLWLHGHIHLARDYVIGNTRIVANPRGYCFGKDNDRANGFHKDLIIELDGYEPKPPGM